MVEIRAKAKGIRQYCGFVRPNFGHEEDETCLTARQALRNNPFGPDSIGIWQRPGCREGIRNSCPDNFTGLVTFLSKPVPQYCWEKWSERENCKKIHTARLNCNLAIDHI